MELPVIAALVRAPDLSQVQLRGVVETIVTLAPAYVVDLADRHDLTEEVRVEIIRRAPQHLVVDVLARWPATLALLQTAVDSHGAFAGLVLYCEEQGWRDRAVELASLVDVDEVGYLAAHWTRTHGPLPAVVRIALVHAALTETAPRPRLTDMSEWERRQAIERLTQEENKRAGKAWQLLEPAPQLWEQLARDGKEARNIRRILLNRAEQLADDVLLACLPEVTNDGLRDGDDLFAGIRLSEAADHARRWPRLKELASAELSRIVREAVDDGWTPDNHVTNWTEITALAELSDDVALLTKAVTAIRDATKPESSPRHRHEAPSWEQRRVSTVTALTVNPVTPGAELISLLPVLDESALLAVQRHSDGDLHAAARSRLVVLRREAEASRPILVPVPSDEELAESDDPEAELRSHLKYLRARAEQRDVTCQGLLRSRFTTADMLRTLPAHYVLGSAEQAELTASMITDACGDNASRWQSVAGHLDPPPRKTITFEAWLDLLTGACQAN